MSCMRFCLQPDTVHLFQHNLPDKSSPGSISKWVRKFWSACSAGERKEGFPERIDVEPYQTADKYSEITISTKCFQSEYTKIDENCEDPLLSNTTKRTFAQCARNKDSCKNDDSSSVTDLMKGLKEIVSTHGSTHPMVVNHLVRIGDNYQSRNELGKATRAFQSAIEIYRLDDDQHMKQLCDIHIKLARTYFLDDKPNMSLQEMKNVLEIKAKELGHADPEVAMIYEDISIIHAKIGDDVKVLKNLQTAFSCYKECLGLSHLKTINVLESMASAYFCMGKKIEASGLMEEVVKLKISNFGGETLNSIDSIMLWGLCLDENGEKQKASRKIREAFDIIISHMDEHNPQIPMFLCRIGDLFSASHHSVGLRASKSRVGKKPTACSSNSESKIADSFITIGLIALKFELFVQAEKFILKAINIYEIIFGNDHKKVIDATIFLGIIAHHQKRYDTALKVLGQVLRLKRLEKNEDACSGDILCTIGQVQLDKGDPRSAFHSYRQALECYEKAFSRCEIYAETLVIIAGILALMEKYKQSKKIFKCALEVYKSLLYDKNHPAILDIQEHISKLS